MRRLRDVSNNFLKILAGLLLLSEMCCVSVSVSAQSPWVVVYSGDSDYRTIGIVHFRDAHTGWAAGWSSWTGQTLLLHTTDGGLTWQEEWTDFPYGRAFFINPLEGWTFRNGPDDDGSWHSTALMEDIELYHSMDGGLSWQLQWGKITSLVNISHLEPTEPFQFKTLHQVYFIDSQRGWLLGHTNGEAGKTTEWVAGNLFLRTSDGGKTWSGQIDVYPTVRLGFPAPEATIRLPRDIDFVSYADGWILAAEEWLYRTTDGGKTWERLEHPGGHQTRYIDFVDAQNGWAARVEDPIGVLLTQDGGDTWVERTPIQLPSFRGTYGPLYFVDANEGWVVERETISEGPGPWVYEKRIFYTTDGGRTWQLEWKTQQYGIGYLGYDAATSALWVAGGNRVFGVSNGILLKRPVNLSPATVNPKGKLTTKWGKIKRVTP